MADDKEEEEDKELLLEEEEPYYLDSEDDFPYPDTFVGGSDGMAAPPASPFLRAASSTEYSRAAAGGKAVVIPAADLRGEVEARIAHLTNRFGMTPDEALVLLHHMKWRMENIDYAWTEDADSVRARVGMAAGGDPPPLPDGAGPTDMFFDEVSLEEYAYADGDACACGHWAPKEEWRRVLQVGMAFPPTAFGTRVRPNCWRTRNSRLVS